MTVKSLAKALDVLSMFIDSDPDFGIGELSERTGMQKAHVSKIMSTFRDKGFLKQDPTTRRYSVGVQLFALGSRFTNTDRLCREAVPVMRQLVDQTGHSARLSIMDGDDVVYLNAIEGPLFIEGSWATGRILPPHATAAGKVFLAFLDGDRVDAILEAKGMARMTSNTVCDGDELKRQLALIRKTGSSHSDGELIANLGALGVPIFHAEGKVAGVITIAYPNHLVGPDLESTLASQMHSAARIVSTRLGMVVYPYGGPPNSPDSVEE